MTRLLPSMVAALLAFAPAAQAADAGLTTNLTPGQMALNGFWKGVRGPPGGPRGAGGPPPGGPGGPPPPGGAAPRGGGPPPGGGPARGPPADAIGQAAERVLLPAAAAAAAQHRAAEAAGQQQRTPNNLCLPAALPGTGVQGGPAYGMAILVEPKQVSFFYEENRTTRFAYVGLQHPANLKPSWLGHSVAHWEGDTLVVDTVGFNDKNLMAEAIPLSAKLHVVERIRVVDGRLEDTATFEDPGAFTAPFTVVTRLERGEVFQEYICAENNNEGGIPTATGVPTPYTLPGKAPVAAGGPATR